MNDEPKVGETNVPEDKPKRSSKPEIKFQEMTSRQIYGVVGKLPIGFRNKRQLCEWLEKQGKAIIIW